MFAKLSVFILVLVLVSSVFAVNASDPVAAGCYVESSVGGTPVTAVNEGETFTATVKCNAFAAVYGVQFGTTRTGPASIAATAYTDGTFFSTATGPLAGSNTLDLYGVSRSGGDAATGDFTLGSFVLVANKGLTADGTYTIDIPVAGFKVSNNVGAPISGLLQASPEAIVTITDVSLAQLTGTIKVQSDGSVVSLSGINFNLGDLAPTSYSAETATGTFKNYPVSNLEYTAASDGLLHAHVTLDMPSHLACTSDYTLIDGANVATTQIGISGTITLKAGDVVPSGNAINIQDATAIGSQFGSGTPTGEVDVNQDGKVDIFDLVHVGRNYGTAQGTCA